MRDAASSDLGPYPVLGHVQTLGDLVDGEEIAHGSSSRASTARAALIWRA
jgi:hypothetical protein